MRRIAILGNPNCGKTTLFNALTGKKNKVANWAGVTVEVCEGVWNQNKTNTKLIDLPGCYSLCSADTSGAPDELIASTFLFKEKVDMIINVIDSSNLTRSLYLTTQLIELGLPVIIILNKIDLVTNAIDIVKMRDLLKTDLILKCQTNNSASLENLKNDLSYILKAKPGATSKLVILPDLINEKIASITNAIKRNVSYHSVSDYSYALFLLGGNKANVKKVDDLVDNSQLEINKNMDEDLDIIVAQERYNLIKSIVCSIQTKQPKKPQPEFLRKLDHILTHKYLGIFSLFFIMYLIFALAMSIGSSCQNLFSTIGEVFFITGLNKLLTTVKVPEIAKIFMIQGLGQGITTLLSFIPIVFGMFYSIALLEETGYMPRAAFVTDRVMRLLHLPGKAFIPLIIGFSCNVPAILATRTLESYRDRIIAGLMTPFMMCNARLAVFAIFAATFFPEHAALVILGMYALGILAAVITGIIACKFIIPGEVQPLIMELPEYQVPKQRMVLKRALSQTKSFSKRVGMYIISLSAIISILSSAHVNVNDNLLTIFGQAITPLFSPIGITPENWAATVSILAGFVAKETVIITLSQIYHGAASIIEIPSDFFSYAITAIRTSFSPVETDTFLQEQLKIYFQTNITVMSYMVFNLLYIPCISTMAAFAKETNWSWALFSVVWSLTIAFAISSLIFQLTISTMSFITTLLIALLAFALNIIIAKKFITPKELVA